jgi:hypothetical protein
VELKVRRKINNLSKYYRNNYENSEKKLKIAIKNTNQLVLAIRSIIKFIVSSLMTDSLQCILIRVFLSIHVILSLYKGDHLL